MSVVGTAASVASDTIVDMKVQYSWDHPAKTGGCLCAMPTNQIEKRILLCPFGVLFLTTLYFLHAKLSLVKFFWVIFGDL